MQPCRLRRRPGPYMIAAMGAAGVSGEGTVQTSPIRADMKSSVQSGKSKYSNRKRGLKLVA